MAFVFLVVVGCKGETTGLCDATVLWLCVDVRTTSTAFLDPDCTWEQEARSRTATATRGKPLIPFMGDDRSS
ncbi:MULTISPECIES: hypothetical protein [Ferrimicrobium]|uniref:Secreted protein n=1 Tax=Ferrimicrobium acidiphilum TaxID=121039 RepID=A0ABV3Y3F1_9ACTN|nr:hypothetical protein [Ferrimicrobium sp.]